MRPINNSSSSINTINQCRRKYYYKYIAKLPEKKNIDALIGSIVHKAIKEGINNKGREYEEIFCKVWNENVAEIEKLQFDNVSDHKDLCWRMYENWINDYDPDAEIKAEVKLESRKYNLIGFIDEIYEKDGKIGIIENKTSKKEEITPEFELQIAIYSLLFFENYGKLPDFAAIRFLRTGNRKYIKVNERLLNKARYEAKAIKIKMLPENIEDYLKNPSRLCKWNTGECSYFEKCKPFNY